VTPRLLQLLAIRAQIDALIAQEGGEMPAAVDPETCPTCGAGAEAQKDTSTLDGTRRRFCVRCRTERVL
jgi:hypothetical protein